MAVGCVIELAARVASRELKVRSGPRRGWERRAGRERGGLKGGVVPALGSGEGGGTGAGSASAKVRHCVRGCSGRGQCQRGGAAARGEVRAHLRPAAAALPLKSSFNSYFFKHGCLVTCVISGYHPARREAPPGAGGRGWRGGGGQAVPGCQPVPLPLPGPFPLRSPCRRTCKA